LSNNLSAGLFTEIMARQDWRAYSSTQDRQDLGRLISLFMNSHARVPSALTGETLALIPLEAIRWEGELYGKAFLIEGWVYLNGAVIVATTALGEVVTLFVSNETAAAHKYPDDFLQTLPPTESSTEDA